MKAKKSENQLKRSACPVASTLDIFGDKWTLIVVRDLFLNKKIYGDFLKSPEGIPSNILADRLKKLEADEIINKKPYSTRPLRYEYALTDKGKALKPVLLAIAKWGNDHIEGTWPVSQPENSG